MEVYRIAKEEHIRDLSGHGARMCDGRWHFRGTSILYTSESRSLSSLEYLVHVPITVIPDNLKVAIIYIPDHIVAKELVVSDLPHNWKNFPAQDELAKLGTHWVKSNESLLLRVPSAVVMHEFNVLINPMHEDMKYVKVKSIEDFEYDTRLLQ